MTHFVEALYQTAAEILRLEAENQRLRQQIEQATLIGYLPAKGNRCPRCGLDLKPIPQPEQPITDHCGE